MDYRSRQSMVRQTPSGKQQQQRQQEEDNFMTLPDLEIAGCISDIGIPFTVQDLQKPNPQIIQKVFEWFAELLLNATRDAVAPAMRAAAEDVAGSYADIYNADTRDLMGFFVCTQRLLAECGVQDFTFQDIYKPTHMRLKKLFSHIINFIRFRESQTDTIDEHFNNAAKTKERVEQLYSENESQAKTLSDLERNKHNVDQQLKDKQARTEELKQRVQRLKAEQEQLSERVESAKDVQSHLKKTLADKWEQIMALRQQSERLRPYTTASPAALEQQLQTYQANAQADRAEADALDRRARALQTSADSFGAVAADVESCTAVLREIQRELAAEEAVAAQAKRNQDVLAERSNEVREIERTERHLQRQLDTLTGKTENLWRRAEQRKADEAKKMDELRRTHEELRREREAQAREMERRRMRIEQSEKQMADMRECLEKEVAEAREAWLKMDSHVGLYMREMEGCIA